MFVINTFQTNAKGVRCTEKWSFSLRIIQVMWQNPQFLADLVTFAEEISNGILHFFYSGLEQGCFTWQNRVQIFVVNGCFLFLIVISIINDSKEIVQLILIWISGWFSINNSETVKAVTLEFFSIQ